MEINSTLVGSVQATVAQVVDQVGNVLGQMRDKVVCWVRNLNLTQANIIEAGTYLIAGFLVGFLFKKYFRVCVILIILLIAAGWVLTEFDVITINWNNAQNLAHVAPNDTLSTVATNFANWCRQHLLIVVSSVIGFLIGHKVG